MKKYTHHILLAAVALAILGPVLYFRTPYSLATPDIMYVKAKILQVLQGHLYADPVTGYPTFHPPYYHLFLSPFIALGVSLNTLLIAITISNISLIMVFTYRIIRTVYDRTTAFYTCLLLPFIVEFMGCRNIILATSFYFSVPFYLAGLWLYLKPDGSSKQIILSAVLWGVAFLLSPVYLFLIGLTLVYEPVIRRDFRRFRLMAAAFTVTIIPFFIQAVYLYSQDLWGSKTFALWRGLPDGARLKDFILEFVSPALHNPAGAGSIIHMIILAGAAIMMFRHKNVIRLIPISALAYLFTYYHFSGQYAIRIQFFLSLFIVAMLIHRLLKLKLNRYLLIIPITAILCFALYQHYEVRVRDFQEERAGWAGYQLNGEKFWRVMDSYLEEGTYIFANKHVYVQYIMPYITVHSLGAYKDMTYFQLHPRIAARMEIDYRRAMLASDYSAVESLAHKYYINTAVFHKKDVEMPLFKLLRDHWRAVYQDPHFIIFKKPA